MRIFFSDRSDEENHGEEDTVKLGENFAIAVDIIVAIICIFAVVKQKFRSSQEHVCDDRCGRNISFDRAKNNASESSVSDELAQT